jgi:hypothetical protein
MKLEVGTNPIVEGNVVSEGADVYFECNIKANPWVYRVAWRHNVSKRGNNEFLPSGSELKFGLLIPRITIMSFRIIHRKELLFQIRALCCKTSRGSVWVNTFALRAILRAMDSASRSS